MDEIDWKRLATERLEEIARLVETLGVEAGDGRGVATVNVLGKLRQVRRDARNAAIEEAAQLALSERPGRSDNDKALLVSLADRIRAMKEQP